MSPHTHAREAFNRASHSDALREMQLAPAEEIQRDPVERRMVTPRFAFALLAFVAVVIAHHAWWAAGLAS